MNFLEKMEESRLYQITLIILALTSIALLAFEIFGKPPAKTVYLIQNTDTAIALIFMTDFLVALALAKNKIYYLKHNWLNLLSSIPTPNSLFRALRLLRVVRATRAIRAANSFLNFKQAVDATKNKRVS